ncbi:MAG: UDP-N-acetylglucosamine 2-epimerase [Ignisphaera sp.]
MLCELKSISLVRPLGYLEFIALLEKSKIVVANSGSVQEEAFVLRKNNIITLRNSTKRPKIALLDYSILMNLGEGLEKSILEIINLEIIS